MENDEKKYEEVIKSLKGLQEVKAPVNFEADLQQRINSEKFSNEERKGFWENIFIPSRLIPSLGLVATVIVIFFVVETNSEEMDNPFLIEPRIREDIVPAGDYEELKNRQEALSKQKTITKDERVLQQGKKENEMKLSDDKMSTGKEESAEMPQLQGERDYVTDQNAAERYDIPYDSALTSATITEGFIAADSIDADTEPVTGQMMMKEELNFRQLQLSADEQKKVNELKRQVQSLEKADEHHK